MIEVEQLDRGHFKAHSFLSLGSQDGICWLPVKQIGAQGSSQCVLPGALLNNQADKICFTFNSY